MDLREIAQMKPRAPNQKPGVLLSSQIRRFNVAAKELALDHGKELFIQKTKYVFLMQVPSPM